MSSWDGWQYLLVKPHKPEIIFKEKLKIVEFNIFNKYKIYSFSLFLLVLWKLPLTYQI